MDDKMKVAFGRIWPAHVGNLTRFLIACRKAFEGDIDTFLVLSVIGDRTFSQRHADPSLDYDAFRNGDGERTPTLDINLRSIADFSGIPRETVRRKIDHLRKRGWVARQPDGSLVATRKAKDDLEPLTLASLQYLSAMAQLFSESLETGTGVDETRRTRKKPAKQTDPIKRTAG